MPGEAIDFTVFRSPVLHWGRGAGEVAESIGF